MRDRLWEHLRDHVVPEAKAPVLSSSSRGSVPLSNARWWNVWNEAKDAVDVVDSGFRFHDLRHTGLTIFAQEGATLAELMRRVAIRICASCFDINTPRWPATVNSLTG